MVPVLAAVFLRHKRLVGKSWRMDETCIKVFATGEKKLYASPSNAS
jgi:transposase-like protein